MISKIERVSRPGCRVYVGQTEIPRVLGGMGITIVSTSRGILTDKHCRLQCEGVFERIAQEEGLTVIGWRDTPVNGDAIGREARLDGRWLLRSSDETLSATDLALAYRQLYQIEHGWRDLKGALKLRPVFHYREDRIRAHVQLCWLALLLIRVVENATGRSWRAVRDELERMHLVTLETGEGRVAKRSLTTPGQRLILAALELPEPPAFSDFEVTATA